MTGRAWDRPLEWLRRRLGSSRDVKVQHAAELDLVRVQLAAERQARVRDASHRAADREQLSQRVRDAEAREQAAQHELTRAFEPPQDGLCRKTRCRDRAEALAYARLVEQRTGRPVGALRPHRCSGEHECGRQPLTGARFWHITNADPDMRSGRPAAEMTRSAQRHDARRDGRTIGQRIGGQP